MASAAANTLGAQNSNQQVPGAGGDDNANFIAYKGDVTQEAWVAYTQGRSDDLVFPDLRLVRYDPAAKVIGVVESGHPAHEAVQMSICEQITLQNGNMPSSSRLVPLGSPSTCYLHKKIACGSKES